MNFGIRGDIADISTYAKFNVIITCAKFNVNWFKGLGVLTTQNLHYSIGLAGHSYVSTPMLHCDSQIN